MVELVMNVMQTNMHNYYNFLVDVSENSSCILAAFI